MYFECLQNLKKKLKIIEKSNNWTLFLYSKFKNSEISTVPHLVVPNVDPHPSTVTRMFWALE